MDREKISQGVRLILEGIGADADREGLLKTPERVAAMYEDIFAGLEIEPASVITTMPADRHQEMVLLKGISFFSMCEHHLLPFFGKAHVAYIPSKGGLITGLSKLTEVVQVVARRPQLQERMTS
ncbi:MAG: GTP cyclohydrolase I, partial [Thermoleophilia bacterium]